MKKMRLVRKKNLVAAKELNGLRVNLMNPGRLGGATFVLISDGAPFSGSPHGRNASIASHWQLALLRSIYKDRKSGLHAGNI